MSRKIVKVTEYTVKDGDTLEKIAKNNGLELADLCKFNFGTSDMDEVAKYYWGRLACSGLKDDGSFKFGKDDKPGKLFIPDKDNKQTFAQDKTHEIKLKKLDLTIKKPTKCIVKFRPQAGWSGEFGFDWIRENDTAMGGDKKKYKETLNAKNTYDELLTAYKGFKIPKANNDDTDAQNSAAYINLFPADECPALPNEVTIDAVVDRRGDPPASLKFYSKTKNFRKYVEIKAELEKSTGKYAFKIKAKTATPEDIVISVYSHTHDDKGKDQKIRVGRLVLAKNSKANRPKAKVVFVAVKTNINAGRGEKVEKAFLDAKADFLKKYCKQALITVDYKTETLDLSAVGDDFWADIWNKPVPLKRALTPVEQFNFDWVRFHYANRTTKAIKNYKDVTGESIHATLLSDFRKSFPAHANAYPVFFFNVSGFALSPPRDRGLNGAADNIPGSNVVLYSSANDATCTHELLHAWGLQHSFARGSIFQFTEQTTDNIMDYSHNAPVPIDRIATWKWQWPIAVAQLAKGPA